LAAVQYIIAIWQKPSQFDPHTPSPPGPAWGQWVTGSLLARFAWLVRQPSVLPDMSPLEPTGKALQEFKQLFISVYCWLPTGAPPSAGRVLVQLAMMAVQ
jgi:hypothetical protein